MVYQDFQNDYTEVDIDGKLVATLTKIDWTTYERDDNGYFWRDFGANFFDDVDIVFDIRLSDVEAGDASFRDALKLFIISNAVPEGGATGYIDVRARQNADVDDVYHIFMSQWTGGGQDWTDVGAGGGMAINTTYYCRLRRTVATIDFDVYSTALLRAAGANGDVAALDDGGNGDASDYRYCIVTEGMNSGVDGADHSTGWLDNLDLAYSPVSIPVMMHHYGHHISKIIRG